MIGKYLVGGLLAFVVFCVDLDAQHDVFLQIDHKVQGMEIDGSMEYTGPGGYLFQIRNLFYYVSDIVLTYDGGQTMALDSVWLLVDPSSDASHYLGTYDVDSVEEIQFSIGVSLSVNNNDPALWPLDHPLALQLPSMHWGWAGGYRFIRFDGYSGVGQIDQEFELHSTDNDNLFSQQHVVTSTSDGDILTVQLSADYYHALHDIDLSQTLYMHGGMGAALTLLYNFRDLVFSGAEVTDLPETHDSNWRIYPNPIGSEEYLRIERSGQDALIHWSILDLSGRLAASGTLAGESLLIPDLPSGSYILNLSSSGSFESLALRIQ